MNGMPYYRAYPRDFLEGTIGMRLELKGAYRVVLDIIYMQGGNLPDDGRYISGLLGCSLRKWTRLRDELVALGKLVVIDGFLKNYRAITELETTGKLQVKQRENGSKPKKIKRLEKPRLNHTDTDTDSMEADASIHTDPRRKPGDDDPPDFVSFWSAYPRKVAKGTARKAWTKAIRKTAPAAIIEAARLVSDEGRYTPHPASWLNAERWLDRDFGDAGTIPGHRRRARSAVFDAAARLSRRFEAPRGDGGRTAGVDPGGASADCVPCRAPPVALLATG